MSSDENNYQGCSENNSMPIHVFDELEKTQSVVARHKCPICACELGKKMKRELGEHLVYYVNGNSMSKNLLTSIHSFQGKKARYICAYWEKNE